jgi:HD-GYP domain-containing protein (c-di-GMP phosphodiesterase class II)
LGVAEIADGMSEFVDLSPYRRRHLHRTALLHDLGKLGVSNLILDKPGKMTDEEFQQMKQHPRFSEEILTKISCFDRLAHHAGAHHERLDGKGYFRGIRSSELDIEARILMVADVFEALSAARPYRDAMPRERVMGILQKDVGVAICPEAFAALEQWLDRRDFTSRAETQFAALDRLVQELTPCASESC